MVDDIDTGMHTLLEVSNGPNGSSHVPAFLVKLWKIVDDPKTNELICWSEMGNSFLIRNQPKFARELLPLYYKHNNMASFVRQLNMYGFHKVVSVDQGGLKTEKDEMEFAHPFFLKGSESTLELIKRKIPAAKLEESRGSRPDTINKVLIDVRQMKGRQDSMDNKLVAVKRENEALWRELSILRQKHAKQQQIVSKLLQFLVGMMSSQSHRISFKRRMPMNMPLMLSDSDGLKSAKRNKKSGEFGGPVIRDVTELMSANDRMLENQDFNVHSSEMDPHPKIDSPGSSSMPDRSPYSESVYPMSPYDDPEMLLSVDPMSINPSVEIQSRASVNTLGNSSVNAVPKKNSKVGNKGVKTQPRPSKMPAATSSYVSSANVASSQIADDNKMFLQTDNQLKQNVPTVMYIPETGEQPVQVVLSLPEPATTAENTVTGINSGVQVNSSNESFPSAVAVMKPVNLVRSSEPVALQVPVQGMTKVEGNTNDTSTEVVLSDGQLSRHQAIAPSKLLSSSLYKEDFDGHVGDVQSGLDNLRELLKQEQYSIDSNTLMTLFGADADTSELLSLKPGGVGGNDVNEEKSSSDPSSEMVAYNPSLYELADEDFFDYQNNGVFLDDELEKLGNLLEVTMPEAF
ncbi:unnamed protein product [Allacma fusca]|uniref:HSF-type DNA-binding domain-containing protein n=1 Tax=Allacma fusca TaxID=39272 RepID=A0A8J2MF25_9HEXA|nr:unnamed protein product [Allacma fusca]